MNDCLLMVVPRRDGVERHGTADPFCRFPIIAPTSPKCGRAHTLGQCPWSSFQRGPTNPAILSLALHGCEEMGELFDKRATGHAPPPF